MAMAICVLVLIISDPLCLWKVLVFKEGRKMNEKVVKKVVLKKCESSWMSWDEGEVEASGVISSNFVLLLLLLSTSSSLPRAPHLACSSTKDEWQLSQVKDFH